MTLPVLGRLETSSPLFAPVALVLGILVVATVAVFLVRRLAPGVKIDEIDARVRSWWLMATVFFVAVLLSKTGALVFFSLVCFWALKEFFSLVPGRMVDRAAIFFAYLAVPFQFLWIGKDWYGMFIVFIPVYLFLFLPFVLMTTGETKGFVVSASRIHWGLMTFVFGLSHAAALLSLPEKAGFRAGGQGLVLFLVLLTQLNDVFQFLTGKTFGGKDGKRIAPSVSPNKTWAGFLGGVALTTPLAYLLRFLTPFDGAAALAVGAGLAMAGFAGDLVMASVKRDVGVKDASSAIPGHGGVLDRVNSLCYTAPLFFHVVRYFHY